MTGLFLGSLCGAYFAYYCWDIVRDVRGYQERKRLAIERERPLMADWLSAYHTGYIDRVFLFFGAGLGAFAFSLLSIFCMMRLLLIIVGVGRAP